VEADPTSVVFGGGSPVGGQDQQRPNLGDLRYRFGDRGGAQAVLLFESSLAGPGETLPKPPATPVR